MICKLKEESRLLSILSMALRNTTISSTLYYKVFRVHRIFQNIVVKNICSIYDFGKSIKYYILELETIGVCFFILLERRML